MSTVTQKKVKILHKMYPSSDILSVSPNALIPLIDIWTTTPRPSKNQVAAYSSPFLNQFNHYEIGFLRLGYRNSLDPLYPT